MHLWESQLPPDVLRFIKLDFDHTGNAEMLVQRIPFRFLWKVHEESTSGGAPYMEVSITVLHQHSGEHDSGRASVFVEEPGWMMVRFSLEKGARGFYLFSREDVDASSWPSSPAGGRLRPVFLEAWTGSLPFDVMRGLELDFSADRGYSGSCGAWRCTVTAPGTSTKRPWAEALSSRSFGLELANVVHGAQLPIAAPRNVDVAVAPPGLVSMSKVGASSIRMFFICEPAGSGPSVPVAQTAPMCPWTSVTFYVDAGITSGLARAGERLEPGFLPTPFGFLMPPAQQQLPHFIEADVDEKTRARALCLNSTLVGLPEAENWWKEAVKKAEEHLMFSERHRFWAIMLLAAGARAGKDKALAALAGLAACRGDANDDVRRAVTSLLRQVAADRAQVAEPGTAKARSSGGALTAIHVPVPVDEEDKAADDVGVAPAAARSDLVAAPAVRSAAHAALASARTPVEDVACRGKGLRILLLSSGSRGDVQPVVILAKHLQARGCIVRALTSINQVSFCKERSLDARPAFPDLEYVFSSVGGVGNGTMFQMGHAHDEWKRKNPGKLVDPGVAIREFAPAAVLWTAGECHQLALDYEESHGVPAIPVIGCGLGIALKHYGAAWMRAPLRPCFVTTSAILDSDHDIGGRTGIHQFGAWPPEDDPTPEQLAAEPLASLAAFLEAGPPPIAIGWGSLTAEGLPPGAMLVRALVAAQAAGQRAVVIGGWAKLHESGRKLLDGDVDSLLEEASGARGHTGDRPGSLGQRVRDVPDVLAELTDEAKLARLTKFARERCFFLAAAPHCWLFSKCSCVVHHGGAGTTHTVLFTGRPCIITPMAWDQFEWAKTVERLGVGVGFQKPLKDVEAMQLANGITRALGMAGRARDVGEAMRREPGAVPAAEQTADVICMFLRRSVGDGDWKRRR